MNFSGIGKVLLIVGGILVLMGLVFMVKDKIPWVGRLPGDIYIKRDNFAFSFPLTACIVINIILKLHLVLFRK
ncbi:MAG: DUF2905 domain-containing protein [Planctomycetota bacterium]